MNKPPMTFDELLKKFAELIDEYEASNNNDPIGVLVTATDQIFSDPPVHQEWNGREFTQRKGIIHFH